MLTPISPRVRQLALIAGASVALITSSCAEVETSVPSRAEDVDPSTMTFEQYVALTTLKGGQAVIARAVQLCDEKKAQSDHRSDEVWAKVLPELKAWEAEGKPYIPWAAKPADLPQAKIPAFPGAEGGGMYSFGGRGGKVIVVTNLNDSGPGSFRAAVEEAGPRIVLFNVAGIIHLKDRVRIRAPYITIAGNTAPGDGVCIAGETVMIDTHDVVIRHMRFRRGDTLFGDTDADALGGNAVGNIMIDHVSCSWALDENLSIYRHMYQPPDGGRALKLPTVNVTIQYSIISESLAKNGSTIGGLNSTFHHNLWACNTGRNPSIGMYGDFTFINNVLYNWRDRTVDGGDEKSYYTIVNNTYKPGPMTPRGEPIAFRILKAETRRGKPLVDQYGKAFVQGNGVDGNARVSADNWDGGVEIVPVNQSANKRALLDALRADKPWPHAHVSTTSAAAAYETVLVEAGATLPRRDAVDARIVAMTRSGTATHGVGIVRSVDEVGGYPVYAGTSHVDSDNDGMPDDWEKQNGLNPVDPSDAMGDTNRDGYTHIEDYINGTSPRLPVTGAMN